MAILVGKQAERVAAAFLTNKGYTVVDQNVSYSFGELDLIMWHKEVLVFCEVKYRKDQSFSLALEAVNRSKQRKIILAAHAYLNKYHRVMPACRFDVVAISGDLKNPAIEHIEDAFLDEG